MIKDSGDRTEFETGAKRDMHAGKGRMDLLPWALNQRQTRPELDDRWKPEEKDYKERRCWKCNKLLVNEMGEVAEDVYLLMYPGEVFGYLTCPFCGHTTKINMKNVNVKRKEHTDE